MGSIGVLIASLAHPLNLACSNFLSGSYFFAEVMCIKFSLLAFVAWIVMRIKKIPIKTERAGLHAVRICLAVLAAACLIYAAFVLPVGMASCCGYATAIFVAFFVVLGKWLRNEEVSPTVLGLFFLAALGFVLVDRPFSYEGASRIGLWVGVLGAAAGAGSCLLLRQLAHAGEPASRTVFYFSVSTVIVSLTISIVHSRSGGVSLSFDPWLLVSAAMTVIVNFGRTVGWGKAKPIVNAVFHLMGLPFAFALGYVIFGQTYADWALFGLLLISLSAMMIPFSEQIEQFARSLKSRS